jgi:hypothetical protein
MLKRVPLGTHMPPSSSTTSVPEQLLEDSVSTSESAYPVNRPTRSSLLNF